MDTTNNDEQAKLWNGPGAKAWIGQQDLLDEVMRPIETLLVEAARSAGAQRVLDVGCGTGGTTIAVAKALPAGGSALGVDISAPMIEVARRRAEAAGALAEFAAGDAQSFAFEPGAVDLVVSRFGVMFFADPVQAFANLAAASAPGAGMCCVVWRSAAENPFMTTAERAAAPLLPTLQARKGAGPGQFAFADPAQVGGWLESAGWREVDLQPLDIPCALPLSQLQRYAGTMGPVGAALLQVDEATRERVVKAVVDAFQPYVRDGALRYTAACWKVGARRG